MHDNDNHDYTRSPPPPLRSRLNTPRILLETARLGWNLRVVRVLAEGRCRSAKAAGWCSRSLQASRRIGRGEGGPCATVDRPSSSEGAFSTETQLLVSCLVCSYCVFVSKCVFVCIGKRVNCFYFVLGFYGFFFCLPVLPSVLDFMFPVVCPRGHWLYIILYIIPHLLLHEHDSVSFSNALKHTVECFQISNPTFTTTRQSGS